MSGIVWLASYPKSGNTWFRAFLTNLLADCEGPVDINELDYSTFSLRQLFDDTLGWESSDLSEEAVYHLRPSVQEVLAQADDTFFKVHEAFAHPVTGIPLFSHAATRVVLYILRNPLDVAVSYSHHIGKDIDATIARMNNRAAQIYSAGDRLRPQISQPLGDWSGHVRSWVDAPGVRVHVIRYEDMLASPHETFIAACCFASLPDEPARVARAIRNSSFKELKHQEQAGGFREASPRGSQFFRSGRAGGWREILSQKQIADIVGAHGEVMRRFGYLMPDGSCP